MEEEALKEQLLFFQYFANRHGKSLKDEKLVDEYLKTKANANTEGNLRQ